MPLEGHKPWVLCVREDQRSWNVTGDESGETSTGVTRNSGYLLDGAQRSRVANLGLTCHQIQVVRISRVTNIRRADLATTWTKPFA